MFIPGFVGSYETLSSVGKVDFELDFLNENLLKLQYQLRS